MVVPLSLDNTDIVEQLWLLKHMGYRLEAIALGLQEYPPLSDTFDSIRNSKERYYGWLGENQELKGAIAVSLEKPDIVEISRITVHTSSMRQGIGRALVEFVIQEYPLQQIEVTAGARNKPATSLYRSFGFKEIESYYIRPDVELIRFELSRASCKGI
ncbi:putative acetyltransferase [compost metagenome]